MPQLIVMALVGAGLYAGYRWLSRSAAEITAEVRRTEDELRRRAGLPLPAGRKQGLSSLRHSVATRLLEADTPLEVISAVLGHRSLESTQIYLKVDLEHLRSAALEIAEVSHD